MKLVRVLLILIVLISLASASITYHERGFVEIERNEIGNIVDVEFTEITPDYWRVDISLEADFKEDVLKAKTEKDFENVYDKYKTKLDQGKPTLSNNKGEIVTNIQKLDKYPTTSFKENWSDDNHSDELVSTKNLRLSKQTVDLKNNNKETIYLTFDEGFKSNEIIKLGFNSYTWASGTNYLSIIENSTAFIDDTYAADQADDSYHCTDKLNDTYVTYCRWYTCDGSANYCDMRQEGRSLEFATNDTYTNTEMFYQLVHSNVTLGVKVTSGLIDKGMNGTTLYFGVPFTTSNKTRWRLSSLAKVSWYGVKVRDTHAYQYIAPTGSTAVSEFFDVTVGDEWRFECTKNCVFKRVRGVNMRDFVVKSATCSYDDIASYDPIAYPFSIIETDGVVTARNMKSYTNNKQIFWRKAPYNMYCINCELYDINTLEPYEWQLYFSPNAPIGGTMHQQYEIDITVLNQTQDPIPGANVTFYLKNGTIEYQNITDANGVMPTGVLTKQTITEGYDGSDNLRSNPNETIYWYTPHTLNVYKEDYGEYNVTWNITTQTKWIVSLTADPCERLNTCYDTCDILIEPIDLTDTDYKVFMDFSDNVDDPIILDNSTFENNGTSHGATWNAVGKYGGGYDLDADNAEWINIPYDGSFDLNNNLTVGAWFYMLNNHTVQNLAAKWDLVDNKRSWVLSIQNEGKIKGYVSDNGNNDVADRSVTYTANAMFNLTEWVHIAMVYQKDTNLIDIYVNGVNVTDDYDANGADGIFSNNVNISIGKKFNSGSPELFNGSVDNFMVINATFTGEEIKRIMMNNTESGVDSVCYDACTAAYGDGCLDEECEECEEDPLVCEGYTEFANVAEVTTGTLESGTLADLHEVDGTAVVIKEAIATPGLVAYFNLTNANLTENVYWRFNTTMKQEGTGGSHEIRVYIYDNDNAVWDNLIVITDTDEFKEFTNYTIGKSGYYNDDRTIQIKIEQPELGKLNHKLHIDYGSISEICQYDEDLILIQGGETMGYEIASVIALIGLTGFFLYLGWKIKKNKFLSFMFTFLSFLMIATLIFNLVIFSAESGTWVIDSMVKSGDDWSMSYTQQGSLSEMKNMYQAWFLVIEMIIVIVIGWFFLQFVTHRIKMIDKYKNPNGPADGDIEFDPLE